MILDEAGQSTPHCHARCEQLRVSLGERTGNLLSVGGFWPDCLRHSCTSSSVQAPAGEVCDRTGNLRQLKLPRCRWSGSPWDQKNSPSEEGLFLWLTLADELRTASIDFDERKLSIVKEVLV